MRTFPMLGLLLAFATLSACADDGSLAADPVDAIARDLDMPEYTWHQDHPDRVQLLHSSEGFCFLTRASGAFIGEEEWIEVRVSSTDGYWYLSGHSAQQAVTTSARCVRWSELGVTEDHALSPEFETGYWFDSGGIFSPLKPDVDWPLLWDRRSFCFLTQVHGALDGDGEYLAIEPENGVWRLQVNNMVGNGRVNGTWGRSQCVHLGQVGDVRFVGGDASGEHHWKQGNAWTPMAPVGSAYCFLTGITGNFDGGGEAVQIMAQGGTWYLGGTSGRQDVGGSARCVATSQVYPGRVVDPGFENQSGRDLAYPWYGAGAGAKGFDVGLGYARSGANNAFLRATSGWNAILQDVVVQPGRSYTISVATKTSNAQNNAYFGARSGADNHILGERRFGANACTGTFCCVGCAPGWSRQTVTFTAGPSDTSVHLYVGYFAPGTDSWIQLDDWQMAAD